MDCLLPSTAIFNFCVNHEPAAGGECADTAAKGDIRRNTTSWGKGLLSEGMPAGTSKKAATSAGDALLAGAATVREEEIRTWKSCVTAFVGQYPSIAVHIQSNTSWDLPYERGVKWPNQAEAFFQKHAVHLLESLQEVKYHQLVREIG